MNIPQLKTWVEIPEKSDFTIYNLPYGIYKIGENQPAVGVAIGEDVLQLDQLWSLGLLAELDIEESVFLSAYLNDYIALGKPVWSGLRKRLQELLCDEAIQDVVEKALVKMDQVKMLMPVKVGDYTDFYSSIEHATNVGKMFRDPENALLPNWKHLPVAYHGRASSIVVSGTDITRPKGQKMPPGAEKPVFGPSSRMDFELEMAFVIGKETELGTSISTKKAEDHIFGMVIFNDWSARDIQKWEYVPLGPFLGKNFASSISPWIVTMEALEPFRTNGPEQEPEVLPYLKYEGNKNYDINLEVYLQPESGKENLICQSNFGYLYWNMCQQLAHHTINGCNVNVGDMMASGTISGKGENEFGSMLELSWGGKNPIQLDGENTRTFLEDNDTVIMRGFAENGEIRVGFGEVRGKLLPAKP
ncbi:fumarylacetoacetase [Flexithrix dorotheae]|uniref:fumarylacetoacetase n=1 Tax=Flexithrix dorotheae TaxID=70993 RepID=UPI00037E515C|nr:fumarylacetoacetase [Flexithrix dorotheae]